MTWPRELLWREKEIQNYAHLGKERFCPLNEEGEISERKNINKHDRQKKRCIESSYAKVQTGN